MNCEEVQSLAVAYLDREVSPSERTLIQSHLVDCAACREEMEQLFAFRRGLSASLHRQVATVEPAPQALARLQERLAVHHDRPLSTQFRSFFEGGLTMKKVALGLLVFLIVFTGLAAFVPPVQAQVREALKRIVLGENSEAVQVPAPGPESELPASAAAERPHLPGTDMWIIRTDIGNFGGNTAVGVSPQVRTFSTVAEAQAAASFEIKVPADLPAGYAFREARLIPAGGTVFLFYSGPEHDLVIVETPVGPQPSDQLEVAIAVQNMLLTDGAIEAVDFDGRTAAWIDGRSLMWEADGLSCTVGGQGLTMAQVMQVARSLQ